MQQHLRHLHEIQKIDLGIRELELGCASMPQRLRELEESVGKIRTEIAEMTEKRDAILKEKKELEGTVQSENQKVRKWGQRLNEIRNQREYLALSREVEGSKRATRETEEKIQELVAAKNQLEAQLDEIQDRLAEQEIDCEEERERVERAQSATQEQIAAEKGRRESLIHTIPALLLNKYEAIRIKRLGVGLVSVVEGSCTGCNMKLPPQLYNILQRGDTLEQCPSCSRLVVWERLLEHVAPSPSHNIEASP